MHWFDDSRFYYNSLSDHHFFNSKKYQEINNFKIFREQIKDTKTK